MYSENYYTVILKNGEVCDFDKRCESIDEVIPNILTFKDKYGLCLASIPKDNIWTMFNSTLEKHDPFKILKCSLNDGAPYISEKR